MVLGLFSLHFLVICAFIIAKTARDGLYLSSLSATTLPYVYLGLAFWTALALALYGRFFGRLSSHVALAHGLWGTSLTLLLFFLWFHLKPDLPAIVFYLWIGAYGILLVSQFWILANERINPRQGKRLLGVIGAGGVLGGMVGGGVASQLVRIAQPEWLLVLAAALHMAAAGVAARSGRRPEEAPPDAADVEEDQNKGLRSILGQRYLRLIAVTLLLGGVTAGVVDYEFKLLLQERFAAPEEIRAGLGAEKTAGLTTFIGYFYGAQNVLMLMVQLGLTGFVLTRLGARSTAMVLPGGLLALSLATIALPHFFLVAATWLHEAISRITVVRSAREFLYFPLKEGIRGQAKRFMETVVNRSAEAAAAVLIILVSALLGGTLLQISVLIAVLAAASLILERILTRSYEAELSFSLRWMLNERTLPEHSYAEPQLLRELYTLLESDYERRVLYALGTLSEIDPEGLKEKLPGLLGNKSPRIRSRALELSARQNVAADIEEVEPMLFDPDDEVRLHAAYFYCLLSPGDPRQSMAQLLNSDNEKVRSGAFQCIAAHSPPEEDERVDAIAQGFLEGGKKEDRVVVAQAAGRRPPAARIHAYLKDLIRDPDPEVRRAAIESAGAAGRVELVAGLIEALRDPQMREYAEASLVGHGDRVVGTLGDYLEDPTVAESIRRAIPNVLSKIGTQRSADALLRVSLDEAPGFANDVLRALGRMKENDPKILIPATAIDERISLEVAQYMTFQRTRLAIESQASGPAKDLLVRVLWERTGQALRRLFRILALVYPRRETRLAYRGVMSKNVRLRAHAIEYIESVLSAEHRPIVMPLVEAMGHGDYFSRARGRDGDRGSSLSDALNEIAGVPDSWLIACVLYAVGSLKVDSLRGLASSSARAEDPYIREMGKWAQDNLASAGA